MLIKQEYLKQNKNHIFVFGDNTLRKGLGGAAALRNEPNTYGFITKKYPNMDDEAFYKLKEYKLVFEKELFLLERAIVNAPNSLWLISQLGSGLANKYKIWEEVIFKKLKKLPDRYTN